MTVKAILSRKGNDVVTIKPTATLGDAIKILDMHRIGAVVITRRPADPRHFIGARCCAHTCPQLPSCRWLSILRRARRKGDGAPGRDLQIK